MTTTSSSAGRQELNASTKKSGFPNEPGSKDQSCKGESLGAIPPCHPLPGDWWLPSATSRFSDCFCGHTPGQHSVTDKTVKGGGSIAPLKRGHTELGVLLTANFPFMLSELLPRRNY